jgi:hypothetical protein
MEFSRSGLVLLVEMSLSAVLPSTAIDALADKAMMR